MNTSVKRLRLLGLIVALVLLIVGCGEQTGPGDSPSGNAPSGAAPGGTNATNAAGPGAGATSAADDTSATSEPDATSTSGNAPGTIKIGSKNFTEMYIMGELYAQLLEANGFTVERKFDLGATPIAQQAITSGDIELYPEYTSTGVQEILQLPPITDAQEMITTLRGEYEKQFQLTWLEPSAFNNTNTFAVTQDTATKYSLKTYSDLFSKAGELRLGGPPEFPERNDTKNLQQVYGAELTSFKEYQQLGTGALRYDALTNGDVEAVVAFSTDGRIRVDNLVLLEDDKKAYPEYNVAPVIRQDTLEKYPQVADILNKLAPLLTEDVMQNLNYQVDGPDAKQPADVAKTFLTEQGLLQ